MGCVNSKTDINDRHPNIFQVTNVNDQGKPISPGKLQITETELVFYQRGKEPTKWPLRSLRKYGFDTEVFSFECGRRCPTGHGIYAFKCKKAEYLFNIVQQYITGNMADDSTPALSVVDPLLSSTIPQPAIRRPTVGFQSEGYLNPVTTTAASMPLPSSRPPLTGTSRPGSVSSNGPISPTTMTSSPPLSETTPAEHNNNQRGSVVTETIYPKTGIVENGSILPHYANLLPGESIENSNRVYMNVDTSNCTKDLTEEPEEKHCYANIDSKDIENLRPMTDAHFNSVPQTPTIAYNEIEYSLNYVAVREVNYAELDLEVVGVENTPTTSQVVPDSPKVEKKSYATIDFQKTTALSQSINPRMTVEEGSRKTRHNSTINYNNLSSD